MKKRTRKPAVSIETARQWLKRHEEGRETVPQIADTDDYDVRTVRKQLDRAREDREKREAMQTVYREAIMEHYRDLCSFAEKIKTEIFSSDEPVPVSPDLQNEPMWNALYEHLRKSRLQHNIEQWQKIVPRYDDATNDLRERIRKEAVSRSQLEFTSQADRPGLVYGGFDDALVQRLSEAASGTPGLAKIPFTTRREGTHIWLGRGGYGLALVEQEKVQEIESLFENMMAESLAWEEYTEFAKLTNSFLKIRRNIQEELTTVILRRIVPGKCRYCPV